MSQLKIADLSFCETELNNSREIKGGISSSAYSSSYYYSFSFLFPNTISDLELVDSSLTDDGYNTSYLYDDNTGDFAFIVSKETNSGKVVSGVAESYSYNGKTSSSFAFASS